MRRIALFVASALLAGCYVELASSALGPSEPGLITALPAALVVPIGGTTQLTVELLAPDSTRAAEQPSSFSFTSSDEAVATVDARGLVRGVGEGWATLEITDGRHGTRVVPMTVSATVGAGPVTMTCGDPVVFIAVGQTLTPAFTLTDATGAVVDSSAVGLTIEDPTLARVEGDGSITGLAAGRTYLTAGSLDGGCSLVVVQTSGSSGGGGFVCDGSDWEEYCEISHFPLSFPRPGLSSPVRLSTYYMHVDDHCVWHSESIVEDDADGVTFDAPGVLDHFAGRLQASAPGATGWHASWRGPVTGDEYRCGTIHTRVGIDLNGDWSMQCANGDHGSVSLSGGGLIVAHAGEHGARSLYTGNNYRGHATICAAASMMTCDDDAVASEGAVAPISSRDGPCAGSGGCTGLAIGHCGTMGSGSGVIDGPDQFTVGECTYTRGAGDTSCAPPDLGTCGPPTPFCSGVGMETCCGSDRSCSYRVAGRVFPAPSGAADADAYARMLCGT